MSQALRLSEDLRYWRAERPDEWTMDRFIRKAEELEAAQAAAPLPATAKVEMPESCCNCPAKTKCDYYAKGPK